MPDTAQQPEVTPSRTILGIRFFTGMPAEAVRIGLRGGLVVVPAAPVLVSLESDAQYRDSVLNADLVITDSGLMVLVWRMLTGERLPRVSGLEYLKLLLDDPVAREPGAILWIMPSEEARNRNVAWLKGQGYPTTNEDCYLAPLYESGEFTDSGLLEWIRNRRPKHIIVCVGGGVQEKLGLYLKRQLDYRPGIHCIGAAIGFITGDQVRIPMWADFLYLGWLFRCFSAPRRFIPRYWGARKLVGIMRKYRDRMPGTAA